MNPTSKATRRAFLQVAAVIAALASVPFGIGSVDSLNFTSSLKGSHMQTLYVLLFCVVLSCSCRWLCSSPGSTGRLRCFVGKFVVFLAVAACLCTKSVSQTPAATPTTTGSPADLALPHGQIEYLWPAGAPGAVGTEERDKPHLEIFGASGPGQHTAVVVCPGGGYRMLAFEKEGTRIAEWLNLRGITDFVLTYRGNALRRWRPTGRRSDRQGQRPPRFCNQLVWRPYTATGSGHTGRDGWPVGRRSLGSTEGRHVSR